MVVQYHTRFLWKNHCITKLQQRVSTIITTTTREPLIRKRIRTVTTTITNPCCTTTNIIPTTTTTTTTTTTIRLFSSHTTTRCSSNTSSSSSSSHNGKNLNNNHHHETNFVKLYDDYIMKQHISAETIVTSRTATTSITSQQQQQNPQVSNFNNDYDVVLYDYEQRKLAKRLQTLQLALIGYDNNNKHNILIQQQQQQPSDLEQRIHSSHSSSSSYQLEKDIRIPTKLGTEKEIKISKPKPIKFGIYDTSIGIPVTHASIKRTTPNIPTTTTSNTTTNSENNIVSSPSKNGYETNQDSAVIMNQQEQQQQPKRIPRGYYIHGPVGCGKSMLMNLFYQFTKPILISNNNTNHNQMNDMSTTITTTTTNSISKDIDDEKNILMDHRMGRYHYHEFMNLIHTELHDQRQKMKENDDIMLHNYSNNSNSNNNSHSAILLQRVGMKLAQKYIVLCIDEFQIIDIADSILLYQLLHQLVQLGTILLMTSNRHPKELYENHHHGTNQSIEKLVQLIQHYCIIHEMKSTIDYRVQIFQNHQNQNHHSPTTGTGIITPTTTTPTTTTTTNIPTATTLSNSTIHETDSSNHNNYNTIIRNVVGSMGPFPNIFQQQQQHGNNLKSMFLCCNGGNYDDPNLVHNIIQQIRSEYRNNKKKNTTNTTSSSFQQEEIVSIPIVVPCDYGRSITIPKGDIDHVVAHCTFDELCTNYYAANDYRAIAKQFHIICIEQIPILRIHVQQPDNTINEFVSTTSTTTTTTTTSMDINISAEHNKARRFITLIDELYEAHIPLLCTTNEKNVSNPFDLFSSNDNNNIISRMKDNDNEKDDMTKNPIELGIDQAISLSAGISVGSLASVTELSFAFRRAASRIVEMTSERYWYEHYYHPMLVLQQQHDDDHHHHPLKRN